MLLQGFACEQSQSSLAHCAPRARLASNALASPPASPPQMTASNALDNLFNSCRSLQALLAAPSIAPASLPITPPQQHHALLATPPLGHAPSPIKLRLRSTPRRGGSCGSNNYAGKPQPPPSPAPAGTPFAHKRNVTRAPTPRGLNKRRRDAGDDMGRKEDRRHLLSDAESSDYSETEDPLSITDEAEPMTISLLAPSPLRRYPSSSPLTSFTRRARAATIASPFTPAVRSAAPLLPDPFATSATPSTPPRPQTPKRARIAPEALPLGLTRSDFHLLHTEGVPDDSSRAGTLCETEADGEAWSTEDDRMLVELVLEKLKLSKEEWQDCARSLGRNRQSLDRRWKSLMLHGDIGLKPSSRIRRSKARGTCR
ncbi:hypothetical protein SEPCBS119000_002163 [Sporothrix epigloea]|uniref:Myb-like domain-containing protein n=1 Tax=Sporothrix epigloea TaxID=1892477 RepID=A0ABP0DFV7_9PEZI